MQYDIGTKVQNIQIRLLCQYEYRRSDSSESSSHTIRYQADRSQMCIRDRNRSVYREYGSESGSERDIGRTRQGIVFRVEALARSDAGTAESVESDASTTPVSNDDEGGFNALPLIIIGAVVVEPHLHKAHPHWNL